MKLKYKINSKYLVINTNGISYFSESLLKLNINQLTNDLFSHLAWKKKTLFFEKQQEVLNFISKFKTYQ